MTDPDRALKDAAERATPGPWEVFRGEHGRTRVYWDVVTEDGDTELRICEMADLREDEANAQYIALAHPQAVLDLLRRLDAAERERWTCFHCGETFTTHGAARDHFGGEQGAEAGCLIDRVALEEGGKPERGRGLLMALRKAEAEIAQLRHENEELENDSRLWHGAEAERKRLIGDRDWLQELDYREGEKLVLTEKLATLTAAHERLKALPIIASYIALEAERDTLQARVQALETAIAYCSGSCRSTQQSGQGA